MRAVQLTGIGRLEISELADPQPGAGEAVVEIRAAALNHRDVWIKAGQYAGLKYPCIPGSDGAGVVSSLGAGVDRSWLGREVVICPSFDWGPDPRVQGEGFTILGLPRAGTLAGRISVPVGQLSPRPAGLSWEESAALPLGGLTAYRALFTRAALNPGEKVLISGVGGGVALLGLQFAAARGARAWVTSSSAEKIERARALGAQGGFLYTKEGWQAEAAQAGPFDVILDSAGGKGFADLVDLAAPGGRLVFYGATRGNVPELPVRKVFWRQISLLGTTMGSPADWAGMLDFLSRHRIRPVVDSVIPFEQAADAFALMERGGQFGKIVLKH